MSQSALVAGRAVPISIAVRSCGFGAEITGLNLSQPLATDTLAKVKQALANHGVIWFPDQQLNHSQLETFSSQFGRFGENPFVEALPDYPNIVEVRRNPKEKVVVFGGGWHSDWSFQPEPPSATILHAKVVPPIGGDTLFSDNVAAYEALSAGFRRFLDGLGGIHSASGPYGPEGYFSKEAGRTGMRIATSAIANKTHTHPITTIHPVTGRRALFVSPGYTMAIENLNKTESDAILGFLFQHMTSDSFVHRHSWRSNMLVMWDNRSVLHCAEGGYDGYLRLMHRTVIAGQRPQ